MAPKAAESVTLAVPSPWPETTTRDARADFAKITKQTPRDAASERAFVASKLHMLQTHPAFHLAERAALADSLGNTLKKALSTKKETPPVPGGVGYGMFYNPAFKNNYVTGTAIYWEIICPNPPGGNVNTWLYLTATNRTSKGVEAFISYNGQNQTFFKVFDWARPDNWQTNIPFAQLKPYLRKTSSHGTSYQVLPLMNITSQSGANYWYNQVWLWNHLAVRWDLVYQYGYKATLLEQQSGWVGSWGPIVETFQNLYQNTHPMGALSTQLISRDAGNQWGAWHFLSPTDSYIRTDNVGFSLLFNDPNYNWAVKS